MQLGPLSGIKVIDVSHHMAGPLAAQKLGDLGADVIKIEPPGMGEWTRTHPIGDAWIGDLNTSLIALNRNKRAMTLNLKSDKGLEIFYQLIKDADVFISNFRADVNQRLKIDYETLVIFNPSIIYCSITGFGNDGPYANKPGQDLIVQGFSGVTWNAGTIDDPPIPIGTFAVDASAGNLAVAAVSSALFYRERTGIGQMVSVNLLSAIMDVQIQEFTTFLNTGITPTRTQQPLAHPLINSPYGIHKTKNGYITIAMAPFDKLAEALPCEKLHQFTKWEDGQKYRNEIFAIVTEVLKLETTEYWLSHLGKFDVWCGPVYTYEQVINDPQIQHNKTIQSITHSKYGELFIVANPMTFSHTPVSYRLPPPELGEHDDEILTQLGISNEEISNLRVAGVIQQNLPPTFRV